MSASTRFPFFAPLFAALLFGCPSDVDLRQPGMPTVTRLTPAPIISSPGVPVTLRAKVTTADGGPLGRLRVAWSALDVATAASIPLTDLREEGGTLEATLSANAPGTRLVSLLVERCADAACSNPSVAPAVSYVVGFDGGPAARIATSHRSLTLVPTEERPIAALALTAPQAAGNEGKHEFVATEPLQWTSSDATVVSVSERGQVTAHKAGVATVRVTAGGAQATIPVTVVGGALTAPPAVGKLFPGGDLTPGVVPSGLQRDSRSWPLFLGRLPLGGEVWHALGPAVYATEPGDTYAGWLVGQPLVLFRWTGSGFGAEIVGDPAEVVRQADLHVDSDDLATVVWRGTTRGRMHFAQRRRGEEATPFRTGTFQAEIRARDDAPARSYVPTTSVYAMALAARAGGGARVAWDALASTDPCTRQYFSTSIAPDGTSVSKAVGRVIWSAPPAFCEGETGGELPPVTTLLPKDGTEPMVPSDWGVGVANPVVPADATAYVPTRHAWFFADGAWYGARSGRSWSRLEPSGVRYDFDLWRGLDLPDTADNAIRFQGFQADFVTYSQGTVDFLGGENGATELWRIPFPTLPKVTGDEARGTRLSASLPESGWNHTVGLVVTPKKTRLIGLGGKRGPAGAQLYRSSGPGQPFTRGPDFRGRGDVVVDGNALFVGQFGGILRSADDGLTWQDWGTTGLYNRPYALARRGDGGAVYVVGDEESAPALTILTTASLADATPWTVLSAGEPRDGWMLEQSSARGILDHAVRALPTPDGGVEVLSAVRYGLNHAISRRSISVSGVLGAEVRVPVPGQAIAREAIRLADGTLVLPARATAHLQPGFFDGWVLVRISPTGEVSQTPIAGADGASEPKLLLTTGGKLAVFFTVPVGARPQTRVAYRVSGDFGATFGPERRFDGGSSQGQLVWNVRATEDGGALVFYGDSFALGGVLPFLDNEPLSGESDLTNGAPTPMLRKLTAAEL